MGETQGANQPAGMVKRAGGVGVRNVRRTREPAPSAPTTRSKETDRPAAVRSAPEGSTPTTRSATWTAPAWTARRNSHASTSRRAPTATGWPRSSSTPWPAPDSNRQASTHRTGSGSSAGAAGSRARALAVSPPPHGFSRGCEASKTVTAAPSRASRYESRAPAGPAPTTATLTTGRRRRSRRGAGLDRADDLVRRGRGRAQLGHHHARRVVGEHGRLVQARPSAQAQGHGG